MTARLFGPPGPDLWIRIRGRTIGAIVCFGFGTYSLYWWIVDTRGKQAWFYTIMTVAVVLVACSIAQLGAMRHAPRPTLSGKSIIYWFFAIVATEIAGIILGGPILAHFHRSDLYPNWVDAVVGIHFLPLGKLFKVPIYYATGAVISLAAIGSLLFSENPLRAGISAGETGLALWLTGGLILVENLSVLPPKKTVQVPERTS
jgi:hypothetical protein